MINKFLQNLDIVYSIREYSQHGPGKRTFVLFFGCNLAPGQRLRRSGPGAIPLGPTGINPDGYLPWDKRFTCPE